MRAHSILSLLIAALLVPAASSRAAEPPAVLRDAFLDGSSRGPRLIVVGPFDLRLGGSPDDPGYSPREHPYRAVLGSFAIGTTEVTVADFCAFLNDAGNAKAFGSIPAVAIDAGSDIRRNGASFAPAEGRAQRPVTRVTWQGARAYCAWLSRKTGKQYDLATAAQWEAAARGGSTTRWPWGDADDPARHRTRAREAGAVDVTSYPANALGLYDMTGNVWEWVRDCFDPQFHRYAPLHEPVNFDAQCLVPEIRGGSFRDGAEGARPSARANYWWVGADSIGFRVVRAMEGDAR